MIMVKVILTSLRIGTDDAAIPRNICVLIIGHKVAPRLRGTRAVTPAAEGPGQVKTRTRVGFSAQKVYNNAGDEGSSPAALLMPMEWVAPAAAAAPPRLL